MNNGRSSHLKEQIAKQKRHCRETRACLAEMYRVPRELPMSEVMHSPPPPAKSLEQQALEFLLLLEQIISTAPEMVGELENIPA
jgi:hypothetical protein